jgi:ketosteroid isomerase-like protein
MIRAMTHASRKLPVLLCCLLLTGSALADIRDDITAAIDYYAEMWNEGDVEALRGYYHSEFVLITPGGLVSLAQRVADLNTLAAPGQDRGELSYTDVEVRPLADGHALAYGRMRLQFKDGSSLESWFSTVYAKTPFGWKAILTHQ